MSEAGSISTGDAVSRTLIRVLLVEDDREFARLTQLRLEKAHPGRFRMEVRNTCHDAISRLEEGHIDVIVLDLWLPDNEGLFTLSAVQAGVPWVPVVILSAADDDQTAIEAIRQGAQDYLVKQRVDGRVLGRTILQACERHRWVGQFQRHLCEARAEESRLRRIVDQTADGIVVVGMDGKIRFANPATCKLFEQPAEQMLGAPFGFPLISDQNVEIDLHMTRGGRRVTELRAVDGSWENEPARVLTIRDITDRKQADRTQALLAAIVESSNDAIIGQGLDGLITTWNPGARRIFGYPDEEAIGKPFADLFPIEWQADLAVIYGTIVRSRMTDPIESLALRKDGETVEITLHASPVVAEHGGLVGTSAVIEDISERKALERMRNDVLAMLTHDMKTSLSAILGFSELLRESNLPDRQADFLDRIDANARAAVTLAANFTDTARIDSGLLDIHVQDTRINELVIDAVRRQQSVARLRHVRIETELGQIPMMRLGLPPDRPRDHQPPLRRDQIHSTQRDHQDLHHPGRPEPSRSPFRTRGQEFPSRTAPISSSAPLYSRDRSARAPGWASSSCERSSRPRVAPSSWWRRRRAASAS